MQLNFSRGIGSCILLKTKGSSRKTEALILIGGGENRTLVLSKLYSSDYMLSAFLFKLALPESAPLGDN